MNIFDFENKSSTYIGLMPLDQKITEKIKLLKGEQIISCIGEVSYIRSGFLFKDGAGPVKNLLITSKRIIVPVDLTSTHINGWYYFYNKNDIRKPKIDLGFPHLWYQIDRYEKGNNKVVLYTDKFLKERIEIYSSVSEQIFEAIMKYKKSV